MNPSTKFAHAARTLLLAVIALLFVSGARAQTGLQFNGSNQYVTFGTATGLGAADFTLECWFKRTGAGVTTSTGTGGLTSAVPLLTKGRGEAETPKNLNMNYFLGLSGNFLAADFEDTATGLNHPVTGTTTISNNVWYHAALTFDGTTLRLYLNGQPEGSITPNAIPEFRSIQHAGVATGLTSTGVAAGYFAGVIDEARIWNYARSQQTILDNMNVEITTAQAGLLGRWGMNEGTGSTAFNTVSGNPNGTLTNTPTWVAGNPGFPVPPPAAPTNLGAVSVSFGQNHLTWTDNSTNETGFEIERSITGVAGSYTLLATVAANTVSYDDLNLTALAEYCYRVRATNAGGSSDYATPQCSTTPAEGDHALQLNGTSGYVTLGQATTTLGVQSFTLECWFKRMGAGNITTSGTDGILAIPLITKGMAEADGSTGDMNFFLGINGPTFVSGRSYGPNNVLSADFEEGTGAASPGLNHPVAGFTPIINDVWYHAAVTYDAASRRWQLFLNGNLEKDTVIASGSRFPQFNSIQHAAIGSALQSNGLPGTSAGYGPGYFGGVIDEARIWNYALTQAEILSSINQQITTPQSGLTARWGMNEGTGVYVNSGAGTAVAGTLMGSGSSWSTPGAPFNLSFTPPESPTGLNATPLSAAQIQLQWADNSSNETSFEIERSMTGSGGPFVLHATVGADVTTYLDQSLAPSSEYCYRVRATNSSGPSGYTSVECATTLAAPNTGVHFGGTNSYVSFGTAPALNIPNFTLETWFKRDGAGVSNTTGTGGVTAVPLIAKGAAESENALLDINYFLGIHDGDNALCVDFEEGAGGASPSQNHPLVGGTAIVQGTWCHAAATYDGTTLKLYLNGNLDGSLVVGQPVASAATSSLAALATSLRSNGTAQGFLDGTLDEVRIWGYARTQAEIQTTINQQIVAPQTGLIARWALNEGAGTSVAGSAGTSVDGSIVGANFGWVEGAPFNISVNQPPDAPTLVEPANASTRIPPSPTLDVLVSDPEAQNLTVTFFGRRATASPGPDFTVVALPDAQYYTSQLNGGTNALFKQQTQWVVDNRVSNNVAFVSQLGDITNNGDDDIAQWRRADTAMSTLETAGLPYGIAIGNHDQTTGTTLYNQFFGATRFSGRPYYGGHFGSNNNNYFELFSASGQSFIVVNLETGASAVAIHWADSLLKAYSARGGILVNHTLLANAANPASFSATGQAIYDSLKDNPNLFLMLCGHVSGEGQRADTYDGHTVYSILSDYQDRSHGGDGWMRAMKFMPSSNQIYVQTYSPSLSQFETDASSQFTVPYSMSTTSDFVELGSVAVSSGSHASITWPALSPGTEYEWYVTVSDGGSAVTGSTWNFTTIEGSSTSLSSSANPSLPGHDVTFTATVTPSTATGTVQFAVDGSDFGGPVTLSGGVALSNSTSALVEGSHLVIATYSGDADHLGGVSPILTQIVSSTPVQYTLTTNTVGSGSVALNPPGGAYDAGTVVTLTATGSTGWAFAGWSGDLSGSVNPTTITMNGNKTVTATFTDQTLVGYWKFDETSGTTAHDASVNGLNGTVNGATWTTGKVNGALQFNGTSSYVDMGNPSQLQSTGSITWSAWVWATASPADDGQIIAKSDGAGGWEFKTSPDTGPQTFAVAVYGSSGAYAGRYSTTVRALNTWYHVAGVYNAASQTLNIYVNGVLNNGTLMGTVPSSRNITSANVNVGRRSGGYYFNGLVDDVRIYNRALTQPEIQALMNPGPSQFLLTANVLGSGTVTRSPNFALYDSAQVVTLTAVPADGWQFSGWSGDATGTTNPTTVSMTSNKSVTATFMPLPGAETISFVSYGDFGDGGTDAGNVANLIKSLNPGIILTNGDNNYSGNGTTAGWDNVVGRFYGQQYIHYPSGSTSAYAPGPAENAFFPAIGNHDMDLGTTNQAAYFDLPPNERYYTFVKGPVQFFALDSDTREPDGATSTSTQALWLQAQLAASTAPWKVVYMHESPYSSCTTHGSIAHMQWPFEQWGADAIISAHDHVYERIVRDVNGDGTNAVYIVTGAGGHGLYNFGTPVAGSQFRYNASYGATFVQATATSMTFSFYSLASPTTPVDGYTMLKQTTAGAYVEDFNAFTVDQAVGSHAGWYDGSPSSGPVVRAGNGVPSSGGTATQGLDASGTVFTWSAHPFVWSDPTLEAVILGMDFRSDANGQFDDDRVCWNINQSTDSRYNFGVQLDNASGAYAVTTYWRGNIANDDPRVQDPIVSLTAIQPNSWYRLRATITKLTSSSARIGVLVYRLDSNGDSVGTPITGVVPNTSSWAGGAPDPAYFNAGVMWPAFKNHTGAAGPADNAYAEYITGTPVQHILTTNTSGNGSVTLLPSGGTYNEGTVVTVRAVPAAGWSFSAWSGDLTGATNPTTITMDADKNITATFIVTPPGTGWIAFNDCVFDPDNVGAATDPNGNLVHYRGTNTTTLGIGTNYTGSSTGELIKRLDGSGTGMTVTLTQSGGVIWQPDISSSWNGGYDPNAGTDAYNTFHGIADMTGVIYYGSSAGWYVDLTLTGLNPANEYTFATSSARCNSTYTNRFTIYTLSGADQYTNASTSGVVQIAPNKVEFNTGDNRTQGYVARWTNIRSSTGTITIRAEADPTSESGYKAYSFDVFMIEEIGGTPTPETAWNADISVTSSSSSQSLGFGQAGHATDGLDAGLGELPLPPVPPSGVFDARFNLPVVPAVASVIDFRDSAMTHCEWNLAFQRVTAGDQVTFTWDTLALQSAGGRFTLRDAINGTLVNVNMRTQGSFVLDLPGINSLTVAHEKVFCNEVSVDSGWNMLSVPVVATDMSASALFPGAMSQAFWYNNGYEAASMMENARGYWMEFPDPGAFTICGAAPTSTDIPVAADWNMVGPLNADIATAAITTTPPGILISPFYGFSNGYVVPTTLVRGKGYWICVSEAGTLHFAGGTAKVAAGRQLPDPSWPCLKFTDPNGHVREVFLAPVDSLEGSYRVPPVPPAGILDVRFSGNTNVEKMSKGSFEIDLSTIAYPLRLEGVNLTGKKFSIRDAINGSILNAELIEGEQVLITQGLSRIVVQDINRVNEIPKEFALAQNYPNPFNPATTIKFALPSPARVKIAVYNVLGAKVADLVDADFDAGYHTAIFDAQNYSSGIYFYQIVAGKFSAVKKMMLLK